MYSVTVVFSRLIFYAVVDIHFGPICYKAQGNYYFSFKKLIIF